MFAEIDLADVLIINNLARNARRQDAALIDDIRAVADAKGFAHVVIGDQHADAALLEEADDLLDVEDRDRIDAREWLVEQDEAGPGRERARDLAAPPLAAGKRNPRRIGELGKRQAFGHALQQL